MKTFLRILVGLFVLGVVALAAIIFVPPMTTAPSEVLPADWKPAPGEGQYATRMADCVACHTAPGGKPFAGGRAIESPMGTIWSSNITADPKTGIGNWTLDQFRAALVDGVAPDGTRLYPAMPYENYRKLSEKDIRAIYHYIMKDVTPVENAVQKTALDFPFNQRWGIRVWSWLALDKAGFTPSGKAVGDPVVARGAYLVEGLGHCSACHSPRNAIMAQSGTSAKDAAFLTGGEIDGWSAPDLRTAHSALQSWSDEDLKAYLTTGRNNHTGVAGEMRSVVGDSLQYMTDADTDAMVAFLRSISTTTPTPQDVHTGRVVDRLDAADDPTTNRLKAATDLTAGERLYIDNCNACHMADGRGAPSVFPSMVGNSVVVAKQTAGLIQTILHGAEMPSTQKRPEKLRMPGFGKRLSNEEVAELATFLRSGWGNDAGRVSVADVAAERH